MSKFLTIEQLSQKIGFQPVTIYKWCKARKIPHFKIGRNTRFDEAKIELWLQSREVKTKKSVKDMDD